MSISQSSYEHAKYMHCWERLKLEGYKLEECPKEAPLYGFGHNAVPIVGRVRLPILFGKSPLDTLCFTKLYVINTPSSYNMILGRPTLVNLQAITSIPHLKMKFPTHRGVYCYKVMPFGLINAGATYQRMMNKIFSGQLGRNMEVYVDDMIIKSMANETHLQDLKECFDTLRTHNMKLNPDKCTFALGAGKFLGFLVSQRGIEANPEKIQAILDMHPPRTIRDVQRLTGRLAALRRFISKLAERCLPFFNTLRGATSTKTIEWTPACQTAFEELKAYLSTPPLLTTASPSEPLSLYLSASNAAVGAVLIKEEGGHQQPIYYVSQVLKDAETRYPSVEKFAYALVVASMKLRHYFQGRDIKVITNQPLRKILHKPDLSGRLINWAVELSQFNILLCTTQGHQSPGSFGLYRGMLFREPRKYLL